MRTMIAVPCMDMVHTFFFTSMLSMRKPEGTELAVASCSLIYEARHNLAMKAINDGFDRVLWMDSDMNFGPDLMERLEADLDQGYDFVTGLYFTRKNPVKPCVYEVCHPKKRKTGEIYPAAENVKKLPAGIFEIEGCGFGCVMMTTELMKACGEIPFFPMEGYGEDLTFCRKARAAGYKLYCDPTIKADHLGISIINETQWRM